VRSLARFAIRRRWWVIGAWIVAIALVHVASIGIGGASYTNDFKLPGSESQKVADLLTAADLNQENNASGTMVLRATDGTLTREPAGFVEAARAAVCDLEGAHVESLTTPWGSVECAAPGAPTDPRPDLISPDGSVALVEVGFDSPEADKAAAKAAYDALAELRSDALQIEFTGSAFTGVDVEEPALTPEMIGIIAALIILGFVFRTLGTTVLPLVSAGVALGAAFGLVPILSHVVPTPEWSTALMTLMVIGVGVDYALFVVTRHRRNLMRGMSVDESLAAALDTSGRAVLFAGITVCIAILGLCVIGITTLYGAAISTALGVALTVVASLTLLPSLLSFLGHRALPRSKRDALPSDRRVKLLLCVIPPLCVVFWVLYGLERVLKSGSGDRRTATRTPFWVFWSDLVQRRSLAFGALATVILIVLAIPFLSLRVGEADQSNDPSGSTTRQGYDLIQEAFGKGYNSNLQLVISGERAADPAFQKSVADALARQENVDAESITTIPATDAISLIAFRSLSGPQESATADLVSDLRGGGLGPIAATEGTEVLVYGETAIFDDFSAIIAGKIPYFFAAVVGLSFLLLMVVFRSIAIPLTGALMNLLAAASSFGVVVAVFQWGWFGELLGTGTGGPISASLPVLFFAILFGLSMDYQVFLVSRIHEEWVHTRDNHRAVNVGLVETGGIITAAGLIMIAVFAGFVLSGERLLQMIGLGLAGAVFLDAFVVRMMLVPAVMHRLGAANWWYPAWLERITPRVSVEPPEEPPAAPRTPDAPAVEHA